MENWKPNYGKTQYKKKNRYQQEDGDVVFGILPQPKGNSAERSGNWSKFYSIHFGYKNSAGKLRTFQSSLVKKDKQVVTTDPALDRLNDLKAKLDQAKKDGNTAVAAKLETLVGFQGVYNLDNNHYMNVIGLDGNIGLLKLRYTAKLALDEEIKKLQALGIDPLSFENGRFFVFNRSGKNRDTAFKVTVYSEQIDALTSRQVVRKTTPEILARLETEGFDLNDLAPKLSSEEIAQIVAESDLMTGKSAAVDRLIDAPWKVRNTNKGTSNGNAVESDVDLPVNNTSASTETVSRNAAPKIIPMPQAVPPQVQNFQPVAPTPVVSKPSQTQSVDELSDADFFKILELPQN